MFQGHYAKVTLGKAVENYCDRLQLRRNLLPWKTLLQRRDQVRQDGNKMESVCCQCVIEAGQTGNYMQSICGNKIAKMENPLPSVASH